MKIVALLPIKKNSQRIPQKNFKLIQGKPLFRWVLDELQKISLIDEVIINTDAYEELENAGLVVDKKTKIRVRPSKLCGDEISMNSIISDDLQATNGDIYLMTHATNPLLTSKTVLEAIKCFMSKKMSLEADSLFTVNKIQNRFYFGDGKPINHDLDKLVQTQDLVPWYMENSNLYIFTKDSFKKTNARIGKNPILFEMDPSESIDIDNPNEWALASRLLASKGV